MKLLLNVGSSVRLLKRSNFVNATVTDSDLVGDLFQYVNTFIENCKKYDDVNDVLENTLCDSYYVFDSFAYAKVVASAVTDNHTLYNVLISNLERFETCTNVRHVKMPNTSHLCISASSVVVAE